MGTDPFYPLYDEATGQSIVKRSAYMGDLLAKHLHSMTTNKIVDTTLTIDVVGFSRGAASARIFANFVDDFIKISNQPNLSDAAYKEVAKDFYTLNPFHPRAVNEYNDNINNLTETFKYFAATCNAVDIDLNFIGLWDTVPHYFLQGNDLTDLRLGIPSSAQHVSHAIAANEHREAFQVASIHNNSELIKKKDGDGNEIVTATLTERSFLGAHADIGGGYGEGDLSDVAFMWMVEQSDNADVFMDESVIAKEEWDIVTEPFVHSSEGGIPNYGPDRTLYYLGGGETRQRNYDGRIISRPDVTKSEVLNTAKAETYFDDRYTSPSTTPGYVDKSKDKEGNHTLIGLVGIDSNPNANTYQKWLKDNYGLEFDKFDHSDVTPPNSP